MLKEAHAAHREAGKYVEKWGNCREAEGRGARYQTNHEQGRCRDHQPFHAAALLAAPTAAPARLGCLRIGKGNESGGGLGHHL